jgi:hypothetical protein
VVALLGPRIRAPPNVISTYIRRLFNEQPGAASGRNPKGYRIGDLKPEEALHYLTVMRKVGQETAQLR